MPALPRFHRSFVRRFAGTSTLLCSLLCIAALLPPAVAEETPSGKYFPPPPPDADRQPRTDAEREAGAVILTAEVELSGSVKRGFARAKGSVTRTERFRFLVLDAKGAERLTRYAFFGEASPKATELRGRTLTPSGESFAIDPDKDLRDLDVKEVTGKKKSTVKTIFFPHVVPGAILDLSWTMTSEELPDFIYLTLQRAIPIRSLQVRSTGLLMDSSFGKSMLMGGPQPRIYWVPFLLGPVPPRTHASLDGQFDLKMTVTDVTPLPEEPYAPPALRTSYGLGFMPRIFPLAKEADAREWRRQLILFGSVTPVPAGAAKTSIERDLDPSHAMVRVDDLALQPLPEWQTDTERMKWWQEVYHFINVRLEKFFKHTNEGESEDQVKVIAPLDLPWRERARLLFVHLRSKIKPDPNAEQQKSLSKLIQYGKGDERDLALYYSYLLDKAHIPSRIAVSMSRYSLAFQPMLESFRPFGISYSVEVGPPGESPIYVFPGSRFATFKTFHDGYVGSLAFRQPENAAEKSDWSMIRLPADAPVSGRTEVTFESALDPEKPEADLTLKSTLTDSSASPMRWLLAAPLSADENDDMDAKAVKEDASKEADRVRKVMENWLDRWAGIELKGTVPAVDVLKDVDQPLTFDLTTTWKPEIQKVGDRLLVPALPRADLFSNVFQSEKRTLPLWLSGGSYDVSLTWRLPPGARLPEMPAASEGKGPQGLAYRMEVTPASTAGGKDTPGLTTHMKVDVPYMIAASEYAGVKKFFEDLQRVADTRLLIQIEAGP